MDKYSEDKGSLTAQQTILIRPDPMTTISESQLEYLLDAVESNDFSDDSSWYSEIFFTSLGVALTSGVTLVTENKALSNTALCIHLVVATAGLAVSIFSWYARKKERKRNDKARQRHGKKIKEILEVFEMNKRNEDKGKAVEQNRSLTQKSLATLDGRELAGTNLP